MKKRFEKHPYKKPNPSLDLATHSVLDNGTVQLTLSPLQAKNNDSIEQTLRSLNLLEPETHFKILKRSIDARKRQIKINLNILISPNPIPARYFTPYEFKASNALNPVIIIGAGPAGLFAALELILLGIKPIIIEQGKTVSKRRRDLVKIIRENDVDPTSNYCFGEGGAGTYSDGKLYTRSTKRGNIKKILELLVQHGADESILIEAHPHIGTNKLPKIIESIRQTIVDCGGEFHFESQLIDFTVSNHRIQSVVIDHLNQNTTQSIDAPFVILATGHSGRPIFELLHRKNIEIQAKSFALGVRIEHPQKLIDQIQYHCETQEQVDQIRQLLPPAAYSLVTQANGRGVYSFCMCPGGVIAPCATQNGEIVTNGWSPSKRNNPFANSGLVVETLPEDWVEFSHFGPLQGMKFQQSIEQKMYDFSQSQWAPAQRVVDFLGNTTSLSLPDCSYKPGIVSAPLHDLLPKAIVLSLQEGLLEFGRKMKNYITPEAVLVAVESRTSSPVRIPRDEALLHHPEIQNLYPCGEGAGYAGGIVSAAMDGQRCAQMIAQSLSISIQK